MKEKEKKWRNYFDDLPDDYKKSCKIESIDFVHYFPDNYEKVFRGLQKKQNGLDRLKK